MYTPEGVENSKADRPGGKQTDLAEDETETVEESLRIHEQKTDLPSPPPKKDEDEENAS